MKVLSEVMKYKEVNPCTAVQPSPGLGLPETCTNKDILEAATVKLDSLSTVDYAFDFLIGVIKFDVFSTTKKLKELLRLCSIIMRQYLLLPKVKVR